MKRIAAVMIAAGIGFGGAAGVSAQVQGGAPTQNRCDGTGTCKVDVAVSLCFVTPNPYTLTVGAKDINIFWELDSHSAYRFNPVDGIKLKPNQPDESEFDLPESQSNGKKFKLHDKNSKAKPGEKTYNNYNIKIQVQSGGNWNDCGTFDPIIINEG